MTRRLTEDDLFGLEVPAQPVISPDGSSVVYVLDSADREADENRSALWRAPTTGDGPARALTHGAADSSPAWSPDGSHLAFLRVVDGPAQLWVLPLDGGEAERLTSLPAGAGEPVWSPDGTRMAFVAAVDMLAVPGEDDAARARRAVAPIVVDRLGYQADGAGLLRGIRKHVFVVDTGTGAVRQVTSGDWHANSPAWSPDGQRLAFTAGTAPDADLTGESAVYVVDLDQREAEPAWRPVGEPHGMAGQVAWFPANDALLVVGRRDVSVGHNRLLKVPLDGGETIDLLPGFDRNVMPGGPGYPGGLPQFTSDGGRIVFCARDRGCTHVYAVAVSGGEPRPVVAGSDRVVSGLSVAGDAARAAVVVASPDSYGDVAVVDLDSGHETTVAGYRLADVDLITAQERVFTVADGTDVHGWLVRDPGAPTPAPLLVDVHGGPHNAWSPVPDRGHAYHQILAAQGWTVLLLNPRGSDGYGEEFYTGAVGAWGVADEHDFLEPVEALVAEGTADPERLALSGYSYGGYMTCWLTGRTDRFAAAVAGGVVADLASMAGTSDMGHLLIKLETALPFEDPERCAAQSPFANVANVTSPTLILHGLADDRCPRGQAEQWYGALRARGVPARLVFYPDASHLFILEGKPSHRVDYSRRIVDWVTHYTTKDTTKERAMTTAALDREHWQGRLAELSEKYNVPGAALGIARGGENVEVAYGVTNVDTGVETTTDTL
ncbi:alpha/beta hydrolase family protein, partial [Phytoactinopolyspora endophytica]|uniref:S9 family peptidase n=1 Tax=Phytoactinopolyspora endophytica TaxID=1642495 RepID=UPI001F10334E